MKIKNVEKRLADWADTSPLSKEEIPFFIAGGAVASLIKGERVRDYDLYFFNEEDSSEAIKVLIGSYGDPLFISPNATSFKSCQIITAWFGKPFDIINNFDFAHCEGFYSSTSEDFYVSEKAIESLAENSLNYTGSDYPLASLFRVRKFIQRGWNITAGDLLKIAFNINKLDLKDPLVLQKQLIGVDLTLFAEMLERLGTDRVEESQLYALIEELF